MNILFLGRDILKNFLIVKKTIKIDTKENVRVGVIRYSMAKEI